MIFGSDGSASGVTVRGGDGPPAFFGERRVGFDYSAAPNFARVTARMEIQTL